MQGSKLFVGNYGLDRAKEQYIPWSFLVESKKAVPLQYSIIKWNSIQKLENQRPDVQNNNRKTNMTITTEFFKTNTYLRNLEYHIFGEVNTTCM